MREIILTQGKVALVDDEDYEFISQWKWHYDGTHGGYAIRTQRQGKRSLHFKMHRVIMGVTDPQILVDHRDVDGLNNQRSNLRVCSHRQNNCNKVKSKNRSSRYKGVSFYKKYGTWEAGICVNYKNIYLGRFETEEEAALAYNRKAVELHGEFALLNEIGG